MENIPYHPLNLTGGIHVSNTKTVVKRKKRRLADRCFVSVAVPDFVGIVCILANDRFHPYVIL